MVRFSIWCLIFGHKPIDHTKYRLENDLNRAAYGDLCSRCHGFIPNREAKEVFKERNNDE